MSEPAYLKDVPCWLRIITPNWPYEIKNSSQKHPRKKYPVGLIEKVAHLRGQGLSFTKIADFLGESRARIRNICENRLEDKQS